MKKQPKPDSHFWRAVHTGDVARVKKNLARGVSPNVCLRESSSICPLDLAAGSGQNAVVELLVAAGADLEGGHRWQTPLLLAAARGHTEVVQFLQAHGAKTNFLIQVTLDDRAAVKRALARDKALVQTADEDGRTALHYAAQRLNTPMARLLIAQGAVVDAETHHPETPLFVACDRRGLNAAEARSQRTLLEYLLAEGANVNHANSRGVTPLHVAVRARSVTAVEVLLAHGADKNARDKGRGGRGSTPFTRAKFSTGASGTKGRQTEAKAIQRLLIGSKA